MNLWTAEIESLQTSHSLLHGWGKLQGSGEPPNEAWLEVSSGKSELGTIPAIFGKHVKSADEPYSNIEFVLYGTVKEIAGVQYECALVLAWQDSRRMKVKMPQPRHVHSARGIARLLNLPWKHYSKRGMQLVRQKQFGLMLGTLAKMVLAYFHSGWDLSRLFVWLEAEGKPLALVIDHDLGGGANLYRRSLIDRLSEEGLVPVLLSVHHGILAYQLTGKRRSQTRTAQVGEMDSLFETLLGVRIERVVFNNILSFPEPLAFVEALADWLRKARVKRFIFLIHDYYCVCPSWLLLNNAGEYCDIPETAVCARCLPANPSPFLEFVRGTHIISWRRAWDALLQQAQEIRCFSNSTLQHLMRAHPKINRARVTVVPHTLDHVRLRRVSLKDPGWPVIGVIGHISRHKGGQVLQELANHIRIADKKARIVVVGTTEYDLPREFATITGSYRPEQLPGLLETHGVNVGFFPSICPETFSYVTEEMMMMGLPILAFDLGAPGERVAAYERGMVIATGEPSSILDAIESLYRTHIESERKPPYP